MLSKTPIRFCILAGLCGLPTMQAQSGITVAGLGYRNPAATIVAGQMTTVSIFGVAGRFPSPVFPIQVATGFPTEVNGLSANFVQGLVTIQLQIRGVQQTACPASGPCSPATTLTFQIPYELVPGSSDKPMLMNLEKGTTVASVNINPVVDSVHIVNTCYQQGFF
jgi:hypothetical protein